MKPLALFTATLAFAAGAAAAPVVYKVDPAHTFPSFEADHMGISVWRGKLNRSRGTIVYDKEAGTGTVEIEMDLASIDFGHEPLNAWARGPEFFNAKKHPKAQYKGRLAGNEVNGELTLHGVTRPVALKLHSIKCIPHPMLKRELCGADASGRFNRDEFGLGAGKDWGFKMDVDLRIQVEALAER